MWWPRTAKQNKANKIKYGGRIAFCHPSGFILAVLCGMSWAQGQSRMSASATHRLVLESRSCESLKIAFWKSLSWQSWCSSLSLQRKQRHPTLFNDCRAWPWDKEAKCDSKWEWLESLHLWWSSTGMEPKSRAPLIFKFHKKATSTAYWLRNHTLKTLGPTQ